MYKIHAVRNVYCGITSAIIDQDETLVGKASTVDEAWEVVAATFEALAPFDHDDEWLAVYCTSSGAEMHYLRPGLTAAEFVANLKVAEQFAAKKAAWRATRYTF